MRKIAEFLVLAGLIVHPFEAKANFFENCRSEKGAEKCMEIILSTYPCYLEKLDISKTFDGDYQEMLFMGIDAALTDMGISRSYARQIATKQKTMNALASYIQRKLLFQTFLFQDYCLWKIYLYQNHQITHISALK